jgi:predicted ATPase
MCKKIVFTGGFSSGKTTTIKMLHDLGYAVMPESSESIIKDYKQKHNHYPWENKQDLPYFHEKVFYEQLKSEKNINNGITFFDRGIPDRLAFLRFDGLQISGEILEQAKSCNYNKVFFFEGNKAIYKKASHRPHDIEDSGRITKLIKKIYKSLGYKFVIIPFCSREERLKIILEKTK